MVSVISGGSCWADVKLIFLTFSWAGTRHRGATAAAIAQVYQSIWDTLASVNWTGTIKILCQMNLYAFCHSFILVLFLHRGRK